MFTVLERTTQTIIVQVSSLSILTTAALIFEPLCHIYNFHILSNLLLIYIYKLHWNQMEFQSRTLVKDIETVTSYEKLGDGRIVASQRTASFLSPRDARYAQVNSF